MPQPQIIANWAIDGLPIDLKISADETFAVVRTASIPAPGSPQNVRGWTYLLDLTQPTAPIQLTVPHNCGWNSSDFVEVIDDYAVASTWIGTGTMTRDFVIAPKTATTPAQVTIDTTLGNTPDIAVAYHATQLTPYAAVRDPYGVTLWNLATGTIAQSDLFLVVPCGVTAGNYGVVIGCSDSIVMSGSRYATLSNFQYPVAPVGLPFERSSAVAIGAFAGPTFGFPQVHQLTGTVSTQTGQCLAPEYVLHDVTMTPDGRFTVVTGTRTFALYRNRDGVLRDLRSMPSHPELPTPRFIVSPAEWQTTDSVEASNHHAVFIGNAAPFSEAPVPWGTLDTDTFRVTIADLDQTVPLYWDCEPADVGIAPGTPSRVHDLAITPNGAWAAVTTRAGLLVFDLSVPNDTQIPQPYPVQYFPGAPDPLRFGMNILSTNSQQPPIEETGIVVCSDSVLCSDSHVLAIGRSRTSPPRGQVFMLNLSTGVSSTFDLGEDHIPTDIALTPSGTKAAVRSVHRIAQQAADRSRITVLSIPSGSVLLDETSSPSLSQAQFGHALGRDQIEASNSLVITAGEDYPNTNDSGTNPSLAKGWVQIVRLQ